MPFSCRRPVASAACFEPSAFALGGLERPAFVDCCLEPVAFALGLALLTLAACCREPLVFASSCAEPVTRPRPDIFLPGAFPPSRMARDSARERGLRPLCRGLCLAVTFRAFARYPPVALLRPLLSFVQRSIAYVLPSSPKIRVWTPCALPHMSQASIT